MSEIMFEQFGDGIEVTLEIGDVNGACNNRIGEAFGDLGFTTTRNSAGLVAEGALGVGADQAPDATTAWLFKIYLKS